MLPSPGWSVGDVCLTRTSTVRLPGWLPGWVPLPPASFRSGLTRIFSFFMEGGTTMDAAEMEPRALVELSENCVCFWLEPW